MIPASVMDELYVTDVNTFASTAIFLYPLKTSENRKGIEM